MKFELKIGFLLLFFDQTWCEINPGSKWWQQITKLLGNGKKFVWFFFAGERENEIEKEWIRVKEKFKFEVNFERLKKENIFFSETNQQTNKQNKQIKIGWWEIKVKKGG